MSFQRGMLLARGATADVLAWDNDRVLKLFRDRSSFHEHELRATRAAYGCGLPVPEAPDGLIEVRDREGILFERIDGSTMTEYIEANHTCAVDSARRMAELHAEIYDKQ